MEKTPERVNTCMPAQKRVNSETLKNLNVYHTGPSFFKSPCNYNITDIFLITFHSSPQSDWPKGP